MPPDYQELSSVVVEITNYFETHPCAADSLEGIAKWWLTKRHPSVPLEMVEQALEYLCDDGKVIKTKGQSGNTIYSLAQK